MDEYNSLPEEEKPTYDIKNLGDGVELIGYNDENGNVDLSQAFTKSSYKFDGIDDYIKIKYDGSKSVEIKDESGAIIGTRNEKEFLGENGFTFEFYGKMNKGRSFNENIQEEISHSYMGILEFGNELRIGLYWNDINGRIIRNLCWNAGFPQNYASQSDREIHSYNEYYCKNDGGPDDFWNNFIYPTDGKLNDVTYFCLVVDPKIQFRSQNDDPEYDNLCIKEVLYIDDVKYEGEYNENSWYIFSTVIMDNCNEWQVARAHMGSGDMWHYLKGECYSLRFYNTALTEEQVRENQEKTKDYHNILVSE